MEGFEQRPSGLIVPVKEKGLYKGVYKGVHLRKGIIIDEWEDENLVVNEGLNSILNVYFDASSPLTNWYIGVYTGNYTPVATDTAAVIASNATEGTGYSSGTRPAWTPAAASGQSISNSGSVATFTFTGSYTIYGAFLISNSTKSGTSGVLFGAALFGTSKAVVNTDQLLLTYTIAASSV